MYLKLKLKHKMDKSPVAYVKPDGSLSHIVEKGQPGVYKIQSRVSKAYFQTFIDVLQKSIEDCPTESHKQNILARIEILEQERDSCPY